jgi:hypothetical protein
METQHNKTKQGVQSDSAHTNHLVDVVLVFFGFRLIKSVQTSKILHIL